MKSFENTDRTADTPQIDSAVQAFRVKTNRWLKPETVEVGDLLVMSARGVASRLGNFNNGIRDFLRENPDALLMLQNDQVPIEGISPAGVLHGGNVVIPVVLETLNTSGSLLFGGTALDMGILPAQMSTQVGDHGVEKVRFR